MASSTIQAVSPAPLTTKEAAELGRMESLIEQGQRSCFEMGGALARIKDNRLYRPRTWETYCQERWEMSDSRADDLIGAFLVREHLQSRKCGELPLNESQARSLVRLEDDLQLKAWNLACQKAKGKPKTSHVERAVEELTGRPPEAEPGEMSIETAAAMLAGGLAAVPEPTKRRALMKDMVEDTAEEDQHEQTEQAEDRRDKVLKMIRKVLVILAALAVKPKIVKVGERWLKMIEEE